MTTLEALDHDMHKSSLTPLLLHFSMMYRHQLINLLLEEIFITPPVIASFSRHLPFVTELCYVMTVARCAPGHSYMNPAEKIMSILNLRLQNVATERAPCDDESIEEW